MNSNLTVTYRVDQDHSLVLESQELSHVAHISFEFLEQTAHLVLLDLNDEGLWTVIFLGRDNQITMK